MLLCFPYTLSSPSSFPLGFPLSLALSSSSSLLPLAGCHNQPCLSFFSFLLASPSAPSSSALGDTIPWGEAEGKNILMVPSIPLCHSEAHFSPPPKKHLKFLIECIPVLSEYLKRGLILGYIKGQTSTLIIFGHYM